MLDELLLQFQEAGLAMDPQVDKRLDDQLVLETKLELELVSGAGMVPPLGPTAEDSYFRPDLIR